MPTGKKKTQEEFIQQCKKVHGDTYILDDIVYNGLRNNITMKCKTHGIFQVIARTFINGCGCWKCGRENAAKNNTMTQEHFIEKCLSIHGDTYILDDVVFTNTKQNIKVICKKHGVFSIGAGSFIHGGKGCKKCGHEKSAIKNTITQEEFIERCLEKHGNKYILDKVVYKGYNNKIKVICPHHGEWEVKPSSFLYGHGCRSCGQSSGETRIAIILDFFSVEYIKEHTFVDCRYKLPLPFDFYIPSINTIIEYDGEQHFNAIEYFGGEQRLQEQKIKDNIKTEYCKTNNISLVRVSYTMSPEEMRNLILPVINVYSEHQPRKPHDRPATHQPASGAHQGKPQGCAQKHHAGSV